jgi:glycosyltransferase involved in cell wall biosynthesis
MRFSVIMPVYLGFYPTYGGNMSALNPEDKFKRAVRLFLAQSFKDAELIIISDGCEKAEVIYNENFASHPEIKFKSIEKQIAFSGVIRQTGIEMAQGEIICYLDHDDIFGEKHLEIVNENFDTSKYDWVYYNDYVMLNAEHTIKEERDNMLALGRIGTSSIAHKRSIPVVWSSGYGHDWRLIEDYLLHYKVHKIPTPQYYCCHIPGTNIDF